MSGMNEKDVLIEAIATFGAEAQVIMVFEEMSELQKALCKHFRGSTDRAHIAEEIADVEIMLEQMQILFGCAELTEKIRTGKIRRLKARLDVVHGRISEAGE